MGKKLSRRRLVLFAGLALMLVVVITGSVFMTRTNVPPGVLVCSGEAIEVGGTSIVNESGFALVLDPSRVRISGDEAEAGCFYVYPR